MGGRVIPCAALLLVLLSAHLPTAAPAPGGSGLRGENGQGEAPADPEAEAYHRLIPGESWYNLPRVGLNYTPACSRTYSPHLLPLLTTGCPLVVCGVSWHWISGRRGCPKNTRVLQRNTSRQTQTTGRECSFK